MPGARASGLCGMKRMPIFFAGEGICGRFVRSRWDEDRTWFGRGDSGCYDITVIQFGGWLRQYHRQRGAPLAALQPDDAAVGAGGHHR